MTYQKEKTEDTLDIQKHNSSISFTINSWQNMHNIV